MASIGKLLLIKYYPVAPIVIISCEPSVNVINNSSPGIILSHLTVYKICLFKFKFAPSIESVKSIVAKFRILFSKSPLIMKLYLHKFSYV
jgi:hypothetical protein